MAVPAPPEHLNPRLVRWPKEEPFVRVHRLRYRPTQFHPGEAPFGDGVRGRFHFFTDAKGNWVPILYGADAEDAAIAETLFRDVPSGGRIFRSRLANMALSRVTPRWKLDLIELHGYGLKQLNLHPHELTSTDPTEYRLTIAWARALYLAEKNAQGLVWMSHQFNSSRALVLFGHERVIESDLLGGKPIPLSFGPGLAIVERCASEAGITIL